MSLNESNVHLASLVISVDLSKVLRIALSFASYLIIKLQQPTSWITTLEHFLNKINSRAESILEELEKKGSSRPKAMRAHALKRFGEEHPDM